MSNLLPTGEAVNIPMCAPRDEAKLAYNVTMRLLEDLWDIGHFVTIDISSQVLASSRNF